MSQAMSVRWRSEFGTLKLSASVKISRSMQYEAYPSLPKFERSALILISFLSVASCEKYSALFLRGLAMV